MQDVRREHFSFSPRMPVGDFYEERDTPEVSTRGALQGAALWAAAFGADGFLLQGLQWVKLSPEEIPSRIQAITGKRGRPRNAEKAKPKELPATKRGRGRPPKARMVDLLSKTDARLLKRLEAQGTPRPPARPAAPSLSPTIPSILTEVLSDEDKLKMSKIKKKMRRKVRAVPGEGRAALGPLHLVADTEPSPAAGHRAAPCPDHWVAVLLLVPELLFSPQAKNKQKQEAKAPKAKEAKKKTKVSRQPWGREGGREGGGWRGHPPRGLFPGQGEKRQSGEGQGEGAAQGEEGQRGAQGGQGAAGPAAPGGAAAAAAHPGGDEEADGGYVPGGPPGWDGEGARQGCPPAPPALTAPFCPQPLPTFSRIPGLVLPSRAFSHCLTVVEFLQSYGKVLGFDPSRDVPSLSTLQEGLLGVGGSAGAVQDLLVRLLQAALYDPGLPPYCQVLSVLCVPPFSILMPSVPTRLQPLQACGG